MPFKSGTLSGNKIYYGNTEIVSVFKGNEQVYSSTPPLQELGTITYDNVSLTATSGAHYLVFPNNGSSLVVAGLNGTTHYISTYGLTNPYNLSGGTFGFSGALDSFSTATTISSIGHKAYVMRYGSIRQYSLSTPFDVTTATFEKSQNPGIGAIYRGFPGLQFSIDGTKLFIIRRQDSNGDECIIYQFSLSTPYDVATITLNTNINLTSFDTDIRTVNFNDLGTKMFLVSSNGTVYQWSLPTPYSLVGASYDNVSFSISSQGSNGSYVAFSKDFSKVFVSTYGGNVYQYTNTL